MISFTGKTVFITGASSGFGAACAEQFARLGARILMCARRSERLKELQTRLERECETEIHSLQLDVRNRKDVEHLLNSIPDEWKDISVLVNTAGLSRGLDLIQDGNIDDWDEMIDTNVKGLLYITRTVLPWMIARNEGHIINIGSTAGHWVYTKGNVYNATKFAVNALTQGMKMDLTGTPLRVTTVDPGLAETEFSIVRYHGDAEKAKATYKGMTPLSPHDVADAVVWAATRPAHVNISEILLMPTDQSHTMIVHRK